MKFTYMEKMERNKSFIVRVGTAEQRINMSKHKILSQIQKKKLPLNRNDFFFLKSKNATIESDLFSLSPCHEQIINILMVESHF